MSRLQMPATIADAPAASQAFLEAINKKLGVTPNLFRLMANSPAALEGYLSLAGAWQKASFQYKSASALLSPSPKSTAATIACRRTAIWERT